MLLFLSIFKVVGAIDSDIYCESGFCEHGTYCCAVDKCCKETSQLWYFGVGISVVILLIVLAYGIKRYFKNLKQSGSYKYEIVPNNQPEET